MITGFVSHHPVGCGEVAPRSRGGRVVTAMLAFLGLVPIGVFVAVASEAVDRSISSP